MTSQATDAVDATPSSADYAALMDLVRQANLLQSTERLLAWDLETMMPPGGVAYRSQQLAQLARLVHEQSTDPRIGELLAKCEADAPLAADALGAAAVNLREIRRRYDRMTKLPAALVEELARTTTIARGHWAAARKASEFAQFRPWLQKIIDLSRQQARCLGWAHGGEIWDGLADDYEPGCTARRVEALFAELRPRLVALVGELIASSVQPTNRFNDLALPVEQQHKFVRFVAERIGFDFARGRLDTSTHPFCSGTNPTDVRMTTRFADNMLADALGSTMHESGHGIYNQGLPTEHTDTPMGQYVSLGIHESQSRLWENQVGRSLAFWQWCQPKLGEFFGAAVDGLSFDDVYGGVNRVQRSLIRVEADEATYNLHIMLRFDLERALLNGDLAAADLPGAWNQKMHDDLGVDVPDDARGCLQDIHWSMGALGYFPTYTLGNVYAAQFFEQALADLPDLYEQLAQGEFAELKRWLGERIHRHGMRYRAADLVEHVTGQPPAPDALMRHLEAKLRPIYGL